MMNGHDKIMEPIYFVFRRIRSCFRLVTDKSYVSSDTYYPEFQNRRYSAISILWLQFIHVMRYGYPNDYFFLFGFDIKGLRDRNSYVDYMVFMRRRNELNHVGKADSSIAVLRNKFLFGIVANSLNFPHPEIIGFVEDGNLFLLEHRIYTDFNEYINTHTEDTFLKSLNGECADGVYHLQFDKGVITVNGRESSYSELMSIFQKGKYLLQRKIWQIKEMSDLHEHSLNTIRLTTIYNRKSGEIEILPPTLRIGTHGRSVDNWATGGLIVGIETDKQCLSQYGYYKPHYWKERGKCERHPDSQIVFEGYKIPYLTESIDLAKRFHSYFTEIHSIGWDIALTESGPCFIEGNDNWEVTLPQICSHGVKAEFDRLFYR